MILKYEIGDLNTGDLPFPKFGLWWISERNEELEILTTRFPGIEILQEIDKNKGWNWDVVVCYGGGGTRQQWGGEEGDGRVIERGRREEKWCWFVKMGKWLDLWCFWCFDPIFDPPRTLGIMHGSPEVASALKWVGWWHVSHQSGGDTCLTPRSSRHVPNSYFYQKRTQNVPKLIDIFMKFLPQLDINNKSLNPKFRSKILIFRFLRISASFNQIKYIINQIKIISDIS